MCYIILLCCILYHINVVNSERSAFSNLIYMKLFQSNFFVHAYEPMFCCYSLVRLVHLNGKLLNQNHNAFLAGFFL